MRRKLIIQSALVILVLAFLGLSINHHGNISARLREAESRLQWLEPEVPALSIEQHQQLTERGEYNPAEFVLIADDTNYQRAYYSPDISTRTTPHPDWCYVPRLNLINQHRLFLFSDGGSFFTDLWGILRLKPLPANWYDRRSVCLLIINCQVKDVFWRNNELMVVVTPTRQGYQVIKVKKSGDKPPVAWLLDNSYDIWEEAYR
ncbi:MAG: hypothetical protein ACM3PA_01125 [Methanomassiliicoccales archaeon]